MTRPSTLGTSAQPTRPPRRPKKQKRLENDML